MKKQLSGFTLVEIAIVFVILAFIVVSVTAGNSLYRTSKLNAVVSEVEGFRSAVNLFEKKYLSLPGDMSDATGYWSVTANGNGNGAIATGGENMRAWQQLALAEFLSGNYTGVISGTDPVAPDTNAPTSKIDSGGYSIETFTAPSGTDYRKTSHTIILGEASSADGNAKALLSPPDAESIDLKIDDGKADSGKVVAIDGTDVTDKDCVTWTTEFDPPSTYKLSNGNAACVMYFNIKDS